MVYPLLYIVAFLSITLIQCQQQCYDNYLAVCVIAQDEIDLPEWIEYHRRMGVSKFYLYDHNSSTPMLPAILPYLRSNLVEYRFIVGDLKPSPQLHVYDLCLKEFAHLHTFMAFIDVDEFITVKDRSKKIPDILRDYEDFGGLALNWRVFGSSGHVKRPEGGVLKNYHKCGTHFLFKTIVRTEVTVSISVSPHNFIYKEGYFTTDTPKYSRLLGQDNPGYMMEPYASLFEIMWINHYMTKSVEDFEAKLNRGIVHGPVKRDISFLEIIDSTGILDCEILEMPEDTGC